MEADRRLGGAAVLRFPPYVKFRFDEARQAWIVLAPERLFLPDEHAVEILRRIDGERSLDAIIDDLAREFDAPRTEIAGDVLALARDLLATRILRE